MKYSPETISQLAETFQRTRLARPLKVSRYEPGEKRTYDITGVAVAHPARMRVQIEDFVGGGFAGQVYRVRLIDLETPAGDIPSLSVGERYAMKILIPPSEGAKAFRNFVYGVGFQAPFSLQVNPAAVRSGALWQTLIRRAAKVRFGTDRAVTEVHATFVDEVLGSCGEISEWIDGRTWRLEVDDRLGARRRWKPGQSREGLNSPEYLTKREFMAELVDLLHQIGAPELARQYEWWTCKSQPNCLKRTDSEGDPETGLTAVDFRAGLALLPFLPMSPGDVPLIFKGIARGSIVQFDRGNLTRLQRFVDHHREHFADMQDVVEELKQAEGVYRNSMPDITHNHVRLLYSRRLWSTILNGAVDSWRIHKATDESATAKLRGSRILTLLFGMLGLLTPIAGVAGLAILITCLVKWLPGSSKLTHWPWGWSILGAGLLLLRRLPGEFAQHLIGRADLRRHYGRLVTSWDYLKRAVYGHVVERLITWHRDGRVDERHVGMILANPWLYVMHRPLSLLPAGLHRFLSDGPFFVDVLKYVFLRPIKLYFNTEYRQQWLRVMIAKGRKSHMITDEDAAEIESQIYEPFIDKYLKSLAVHVCTLPVTQLVSVSVAIAYVLHHPEFSWGEALAAAGAIIAAFQVVPISPGSLVRGFYVLFLVIRERDFKSYNIAVFLSFFKYVGYLAFPIQMSYRYPTLARFMAGHWATGVVHIVPVFGERGALLEHGVFDLFFNYALTLRRRAPIRAEQRSRLAPRLWHVFPLALAGAVIFFVIDWAMFTWRGYVPEMRHLWQAAILVPFFVGRYTARWAGSLRTSRRIMLAILAGLVMGLVNSIMHTCWKLIGSGEAATLGDLPAAVLANFGDLASRFAWHWFTFTIFAVIGAIGAELFFGEPQTPPPAEHA